MHTENEVEVTVIADPRTLLPYRVTRVQRVTVGAPGPGPEKGGVASRLDVPTARYSYAR